MVLDYSLAMDTDAGKCPEKNYKKISFHEVRAKSGKTVNTPKFWPSSKMICPVLYEKFITFRLHFVLNWQAFYSDQINNDAYW